MNIFSVLEEANPPLGIVGLGSKTGVQLPSLLLSRLPCIRTQPRLLLRRGYDNDPLRTRTVVAEVVLAPQSQPPLAVDSSG